MGRKYGTGRDDAVGRLAILGVVMVLSAAVPGRATEVEKLFFKDESADGDTVEGVVGENVVLECEAGGSPSPTIHWLYNGQRIQQGVKTSWINDEPVYEKTHRDLVVLKLSSTKSRLFIDCVKPEHAGRYTCIAETPRKRISKDLLLRVDDITLSGEESLSGCISKRISDVSGARVYMWTSDRIELEGGDVQLFCRADGQPQPTVTWYDRAGDVITNANPQYKALDNGDLLVRSISWAENMGLYRCVAHNVAGSNTVYTFLYPTTKK